MTANAPTSAAPSPHEGSTRADKTITKTFVLDTSVLLFDHTALSVFEENRVAIPITVLEELDQFKVGNETKNFEARECIRIIDRLSKSQTLADWIDLENGENGQLKILLHKDSEHSAANEVFGSRSNDHRILDAALKLQREDPSTVVTLVTKDINLRLKAKALQLPAEDYKNGQVRDLKLHFTGRTIIEDADTEDIRKLYVQGSSRKITMLDPYRQNNHYYVLRNGSASALGYYSEAARLIQRIDKDYAYGIKPKNAEQAFALHAILNPKVPLVTICGVAGTGKTLLALAGALEQRNQFDQIILARPIVALSNRDLGYLPGDAEEKINPYMQPLWDNLNFIKSQFGENERKSRIIDELKAQNKITICPLAYIRGRSLTHSIFIIDEAQNLTPHEVKTIITRAGENCKIILTGDVRQIDTPYLDEQSNGLSYVIDRLRGKDLYAHITLEKGERSDLANLANSFL
ncbi:MAG TPA: ribonuclease [Flavobacteriales bacterium]|jgi:PhoH-like ATPase|nr:ribonuclease [Flavobacteriales bacterium]